jgi:threonine aldolase
MFRAEVGDDVYGEDPSVNALQERAAELTGKQAALFVPSGSMANQICLGTLAAPGDEVIIGQGSHCYLYEGGAGAALNGLQFQEVGTGGLFRASDLEDAYKPDSHHHAPTTLVGLENAHGGGVLWDLNTMQQVCSSARALKMKVHLDGARIFNAQVASGIPVKTWCEPVDTASFCLSKGLGAPVGSLVCASRERIERAHRLRKMFGGAMRQAGVLAAAGLYALEHHVDRLSIDHENARLFAEGLAGAPYAAFGRAPVETNMVWFGLSAEGPLAGDLVAEATRRGVLMSALGKREVRVVTHLDVDQQGIQQAVAIVRELLSAYGSDWGSS